MTIGEIWALRLSVTRILHISIFACVALLAGLVLAAPQENQEQDAKQILAELNGLGLPKVSQSKASDSLTLSELDTQNPGELSKIPLLKEAEADRPAVQWGPARVNAKLPSPPTQRLESIGSAAANGQEAFTLPPVPPLPKPAESQALDDSPVGIPEEVESAPTPGRGLPAPVTIPGAMNQLNQSLTRPWWVEQTTQLGAPQEIGPQGLNPGIAEFAWELDSLVWLAIEHSPLVQFTLCEPRILNARAQSELGQFDANTFIDTIFKDSSDPVGNTLVTGGAPRLNDHVWDNQSGIRRRNIYGGEAELSQSFQFKDSNSDFFVPDNQADSRMVLRYTQPLIRGRGTAYNRSSFVVASLAANQSSFEAVEKIQDHVFEINQLYWELYVSRCYVAQLGRGIESLQLLRDELDARSGIDVLRNQTIRADAAISRQRASLARAIAQQKTAEARLRSAVGAPQLRTYRGPVKLGSMPIDQQFKVQPESELTQALATHPQIRASQQSIKSARVRMSVAEHELRPTLDLVLEGYVRGLNGEFNAAKSFGDQFSEGAPSYSAGLSYSRPYNNTAARAILRERRIELKQSLLKLDQTLLNVTADVESALAELEAAYAKLDATVRSTLATHAELKLLLARWQNAFLDESLTSQAIEQLLNAQLQLIESENAWARAQADHMMAFVALQRATGNLLPVDALR